MTVEEVKEAIFRKGFERDLYPELDSKLAKGEEEIELEKFIKVGEDDVSYKLHIRNDVANEEVYFNKYDISVKLGNGNVIEYSFPAERKITALEAYRMLKYGDLVSVNKDLFKDGKQYNTWISVSTNKEKDESGNYLYNTHHENYYAKYPFDVREALGKVAVPVKQLENPVNLERFEKALKKANLIEVTIMLNGEETSGFLGVIPEKGTAVVYDSDLKLIVEDKLDQEQSQKNESTQEKEATPQKEEVKKKSWDNQKVDWKKSQSKGQSI